MDCSTTSCVSTVLTTVLNTYLFQQNNTICLVWDDFELSPEFSLAGQLVILRSSDSQYLNAALAKTFCEHFVLFGNIITPFLNTFMISIIEVNWRASEYFMVFVAGDYGDEILSHRIVKEIPNILFLKMEDCCIIKAYTGKYLSLYSEAPEELSFLDTFNGTSFQNGANLFPNKKENFHRRVIRIGLFDYLPFSVSFRVSENGNAFVNNSGIIEEYFLDGVEGRILATYCKRYNCSIQIIRLEYGDWGTVFSNLSGEGQLGMVMENKCDIAMNAFYAWASVYSYFGVSRFMSRSGVTFIVPGPKIIGSWLLPIHPFSQEVWFGVVLCSVLEAIFIALIQYNELFLSTPNRFSSSLYSGIMCTYQIYCSQCVTDRLRGTSKRVLFFFCFLIDLIITSAYTGGLATILTLPSFSDVADTIPKMVQFGLDWGGVSSAWIYSLKHTTEPVVRDLLKLFHVYPTDEIYNLTSQGTVGVILEKLSFGLLSTPDFINRENSKLYTISVEDLYFEYCVAYVSKSWVHLNKYNRLIAMIQESGLPEIWEWDIAVKYMDYTVQQNLKTSKPGVETVPLGMSNCSGIIAIWLLGIVFSLVAFLGEIVIKCRKTFQ